MAWPVVEGTGISWAETYQDSISTGTVQPGESIIIGIASITGTEAAALPPTDVNLTGYTGGITGTYLYSTSGGSENLSFGRICRIDFYRFDNLSGSNRIYVRLAGTGEYQADWVLLHVWRMSGCGALVDTGEDTDSGGIDIKWFTSDSTMSILTVEVCYGSSLTWTAPDHTSHNFYNVGGNFYFAWGYLTPADVTALDVTVSTSAILHGVGVEFELSASNRVWWFGQGL